MDLKGSTMRIGQFVEPYEIFLKAGEEFRITTDTKILGNKHIVSCDNEDLHSSVSPGDKILLEYGRIILTVKRCEKQYESLEILREKNPDLYTDGFKKRQNIIATHDPRFRRITNESFSNESNSSHSDNDIEETDTQNLGVNGSMNVIPSMNEGPSNPGTPVSGDVKSKSRRKYDTLFKESKSKKSNKMVVVVQAETDCILRSERPFFLHKCHRKMSMLDYERMEKEGVDCLLNSEDESENEDAGGSCITVKDIKDLNAAKKLDIEAVAISEVRTAKDVKEVRSIFGPKAGGIKILSKIQNSEAVRNFEEILQISDGIMISRGYLAVHMPVEKLFFLQKRLIARCHEKGKSIVIVGQMLESMVDSVVPTTSEINDVSNLVLDCCDCITLVNEIIWGKYPKESLETLNRICVEVEQQQNKFQDPADLHYITKSRKLSTYENKELSNLSISEVIVNCVMKAVYDINAALVISFTQTGSTALKLSKLRCPCPIIAVTSSEKLARQCCLLASVYSFKVGSMLGTESLIPRVIKYAKDKHLVHENDFVVVSFGEVDGIPGNTNSLKITRA